MEDFTVMNEKFTDEKIEDATEEGYQRYLEEKDES